MRKLIAILVVAFSVTACQPRLMSLTTSRKVSTPHQQEVVSFMAFAIAIHNFPFLACTRGHESDTAGGYQAYNSGGPYFGAYQFLQSTWDNTAYHYNWPWLAGANILAVPGFVQDLVALELYRWQGKAPWGNRC